MSHLKLNKTCLSLVLGTVAFQGVADDHNDAAKSMQAAAQSLQWYVAQTARNKWGSTPIALSLKRNEWVEAGIVCDKHKKFISQFNISSGTKKIFF